MTRFGIACMPLLLVFVAELARATTVTTVFVDNKTSLLDGSSLTAGTTYYAAFQLTGGDASNSTALIADLGGGAPLALNPSDTVGTFAIGPDPNSAAAAFQPFATLLLTVTPGNSYSQYAQKFVAGSALEFTVSLSGVFSGGTPDTFSFQLYSDLPVDANPLNDTPNLQLYSQDLAILDTLDTTPTATTPEPATWTACWLALLMTLRKTLRRS